MEISVSYPQRSGKVEYMQKCNFFREAKKFDQCHKTADSNTKGFSEKKNALILIYHFTSDFYLNLLNIFEFSSEPETKQVFPKLNSMSLS